LRIVFLADDVSVWPIRRFAFSCVAAPREAQRAKRGGARRDRTDDLMLAKHALSQLSYGPVSRNEARSACLAEARATSPPSPRWASARQPCSLRERRLVGLGRLELPTSRLSSARSNQLSYKPLARGAIACAPAGMRRMQSHSAAPGACSSAKKEKRRRRNPAYGAQQS
jgi:hypothetical protein